MKTAVGCIILTLLLLFGGTCHGDSPVVAQKKDNVSRTFESLRRVDDHPLYTMHFYADYQFGDRLDSQNRTERTSNQRQKLAVRWACTCFSALAEGADALLGRNFDWYDHPALLLFTDPPDGYASVSMVDISYLGYDGQSNPADDPNALLRTPYLPFDGMNERGLAVGMMAVPEARWQQNPGKATLTSLEVIRLLLDYAATVEEAIRLMGQVNIDFSGGPPLHYLIADASRNSALIEFPGEMVVSRNQPWQVATNVMMIHHTTMSARQACWRYDLAYQTLRNNEGSLTGRTAMQLLESVSQPNTRWSMVYNLSTGTVRVVMGRKYGRVLAFSFD